MLEQGLSDTLHIALLHRAEAQIAVLLRDSGATGANVTDLRSGTVARTGCGQHTLLTLEGIERLRVMHQTLLHTEDMKEDARRRGWSWLPSAR